MTKNYTVILWTPASKIIDEIHADSATDAENMVRRAFGEPVLCSFAFETPKSAAMAAEWCTPSQHRPRHCEAAPDDTISSTAAAISVIFRAGCEAIPPSFEAAYIAGIETRFLTTKEISRCQS